MNNKLLMWIIGALTVLFLILNFMVEAGTIFLILTIAGAIVTGYLASRRGQE